MKVFLIVVFVATCADWSAGAGFQQGFAPPKAAMTLRESGLCGPEMFRARDMKFRMYNPVVVFDPNSVEIPERVIVPGCISIKARNVHIRKPIRSLSAEYIMQIGTHPDPRRDADMPCGRRPDDDLCGCEHMNNTCLFCDFCKRMKAQVSNYTIYNQQHPYNSIRVRKDGRDCDCEVIPPGTYDLEAEVCTPEDSNDIYSAVPEEFKEQMGGGHPVSMFTTIFLYDANFKQMKFRPELYSSQAERDFNRMLHPRLVKHSKNLNTVGCYLMASDITLI